jgi:hypothetical protein
MSTKTKPSLRFKKAKKKIKTQCYLDFGSDYRNTVLLAGVGRSGTTWVADVINYKKDRRYIFEPFAAEYVPHCKIIKDRQYIRPDNLNRQYITVAERVLSGRVRSFWSDRFNLAKLTNKRLIKAIRANLFLKWISCNFPELPIIYIIRHPCAVAASRLKYKGWGQKSLNVYLQQENLMNDYLSPFQNEIIKSQNKFLDYGKSFENHIFSWCIENYIVLRQFKNMGIHVAFYEELCRSPEAEFQKIFSFMHETCDKDIATAIPKASKLSRKDSAINTGDSLIDSWRQNLEQSEIDRAMEIVSLFDLDKIYETDSFPKSRNLDLLLS